MTKIGLFGCGTVGRSVCDILSREMLCPTSPFLKHSISIEMIVVRDKKKYLRDSSKGIVEDLFVDNMEDALERIKDCDVIVEVIGGTTTAWDIVKEGLVQGKIVVTANKALVSTYMKELDEMNQATTGALAYEASVAGGIPIIKSILRDVQFGTADAFGVSRVSGIVNGTTNYILTCMEESGLEYDEALRMAQDKGFAESDPSADVHGWDARAKIAILQRLAFGVTVDPETIVCEGITKVQKVDFEYARTMGCKIKLVATTVGNSTGVRAWVLPSLVSLDNPIATTSGVKNIVSVYHETMGPVSYTGFGAGGEATGHSVVADIFNCLEGNTPARWFGSAEYCHMDKVSDIALRFYIRLTVVDQVGIVKDIGTLCEVHSVSIDAILQNPVQAGYDYTKDPLQFVVVTNETTIEKAVGLVKDLNACGWNKNDPFMMCVA
jgi:homoserine dehydrogenase